jgi:hypothetical protein
VDWLGSLPTGQLTAGALVALIVLFILRGALIPRQQLLDARADRDYWRASADTWQRVATEHGMTLEKHTATLEKLLTGQDGIRHVVEEIQRAGRGEP